MNEESRCCNRRFNTSRVGYRSHFELTPKCLQKNERAVRSEDEGPDLWWLQLNVQEVDRVKKSRCGMFSGPEGAILDPHAQGAFSLDLNSKGTSRCIRVLAFTRIHTKGHEVVSFLVRHGSSASLATGRFVVAQCGSRKYVRPM